MKSWILNTVFSIAVLFVIFIPLSAQATTGAPAETGLKKTVSLLITARNKVVSQYKDRQHQQAATETEATEITIFLEYLDGRIIYYCSELYRLHGAAALADSLCPENIFETDVTSEFHPGETTAAPTEREAAAALEGSFEKSLQQFDDMLLEEQKKIDSTMPRQREPVSETVAGGSSGREHNESVYGSSKPVGGTATGGNSKAKKKPPTQGTKDLSQTDDDIIAKQLREAAEQETDPEVKEKLWEEYRKYKEGSR